VTLFDFFGNLSTKIVTVFETICVTIYTSRLYTGRQHTRKSSIEELYKI